MGHTGSQAYALTINKATQAASTATACTVTATKAADANHDAVTATVDVAVQALPVPMPVPTLSAWLLGLLGAMLAAIGLVRTRHARG